MKPALSILLAVTIGFMLVPGLAFAQEQEIKQRYSISISGGASKGSYEAGLNWGVLKLARASEDMDGLEGGRIRPMDLVSVTGASAGGVNSILSGLTWCSIDESEGGLASRIDSNLFRDTWLSLDINSLLPPKPDSEIYLPDDALFSRRDYFEVADELRVKWGKPVYRQNCRVPLAVTVTRVEPLILNVGNLQVPNQRFYIPFELRVQDDGSIQYFFDPSDYRGPSDPAMILLPRTTEAPEFSIPDPSIIEAAAVTSAFPAAFGRRQLQHCRLEAHAVDDPIEKSAQALNSDLVCPPGYLLDEAIFADGGLFDNLPIGLARTLAENSFRAEESPFPVTYLYIDPGRLRYQLPVQPDSSECASDNPPEACKILDFSIFSENKMLLGALGSARKFELYREATSENWQYNLSQLAYDLSEIVGAQNPDLDCTKELPYFDTTLFCNEAIVRAGNLLEVAYDRIKPVIQSPFSSQGLEAAGVARNCAPLAQESAASGAVQCQIDIDHYRDQLADGFLSIIERAQIKDSRIRIGISRSRHSVYDDRSLRVSSRGSPITGTLLGSFGSFLDLKFREYDYYVGVYDAVMMVTHNLCGLQYSSSLQADDYNRCFDHLGERLYLALDVPGDTRGSYVFARIAEKELADKNLFEFAYSPAPPVDRDMQIIHDGLALALKAGPIGDNADQRLFDREDRFFNYLGEQNFVPTRTEDGVEPLLTDIIADSEVWTTELVRRATARSVYLERRSAEIFAARESDPELRENSYTPLVGASSHLLQTITYNYPKSTFAPSTAPEDWFWRNVIPFDLGLDFIEGDILATWQPTMRMSENNLLNMRISLGFTGGVAKSSSDVDRENYLGLGLGYTRRTESAFASSYGITPTWYFLKDEPANGDKTTFGFDLHMSFMKDRLRLGVGARDIDDIADTLFLTVSLTDLPGLTYWLTR